MQFSGFTPQRLLPCCWLMNPFHHSSFLSFYMSTWFALFPLKNYLFIRKRIAYGSSQLSLTFRWKERRGKWRMRKQKWRSVANQFFDQKFWPWLILNQFNQKQKMQWRPEKLQPALDVYCWHSWNITNKDADISPTSQWMQRERANRAGRGEQRSRAFYRDAPESHDEMEEKHQQTTANSRPPSWLHRP